MNNWSNNAAVAMADIKSLISKMPPRIDGGTIYVGPGGLNGCECDIPVAKSEQTMFTGLKVVESDFVKPGEAILIHGDKEPWPIKSFEFKMPDPFKVWGPKMFSALSVPSILMTTCHSPYSVDRKAMAKLKSIHRQQAFLRKKIRHMNTLRKQGRLKTPASRRKLVRLITKASRLNGRPIDPSARSGIERELGLRGR